MDICIICICPTQCLAHTKYLTNDAFISVTLNKYLFKNYITSHWYLIMRHGKNKYPSTQGIYGVYE